MTKDDWILELHLVRNGIVYRNEIALFDIFLWYLF